jgi:hypothetical protein
MGLLHGFGMMMMIYLDMTRVRRGSFVDVAIAYMTCVRSFSQPVRESYPGANLWRVEALLSS